jgi:transposase
VDTGKTFHKLVARGPDGRRLKAIRVDVSRAGFDSAHVYFMATFPGVEPAKMLVGIEFAGHHGFTFAHDLHRRGYSIVNVLPSVTKKLKEVEDNSPRKDDAKDAAQICKLLAHGLFVSYPFLDDVGAELRTLTTERHRLSVEETRLKNRLQAALDLAWPEFVDQFCNIDKPTPRALLREWPLPGDMAQASVRTVRATAKRVSRSNFKREQVDALIASARETIAVRIGAESRRDEITRLLARWDLACEHIAVIEARLAELIETYPGAKALTTVPGIGVVCAATLVAELGTPESYVAPRQVLKLAGMNLAGKESGTSVRGRIRQTKRGRPLLRRQLFLLAARWCSKRGLYREQYLALCERNGGRRSARCVPSSGSSCRCCCTSSRPGRPSTRIVGGPRTWRLRIGPPRPMESS